MGILRALPPNSAIMKTRQKNLNIRDTANKSDQAANTLQAGNARIIYFRIRLVRHADKLRACFRADYGLDEFRIERPHQFEQR